MLVPSRFFCWNRHNGGMKRLARWLLAIAVVVLLLLGGVAVALHQWAASADFRDRVAQQVSAAAGVPVQIGEVTVDLWPLPAVAFNRVQVASRPPLTLERIEARPTWAALLHGRLEIATLIVRHAVVPEQAVAALAAAFEKKPGAAASHSGGAPSPAVTVPRHVVVDQLTWVSAKGSSTTVDGDARVDADGLPGKLQVQVRRGRFQGARATLERGQGNWNLRLEVGGGTVRGRIQMRPGVKPASLLQAELDTANVEVSALTAPSRTLTGRLDAHTSLRAELAGRASFADALQSQTRFTVREAVVHGIDLAQAVRTVGLSRGGETRLDTLAGQVATHGRTIQLTNLVATSGMLSAAGNVAMAPNRSLDGRITVDLASAAAGGAIGVPLAVGGTLDSPSVTLTRGALLGAAIGTAIAPGVGTGAGAKIGDRIGEGLRSLFGK